jgi:hypothetical protein
MADPEATDYPKIERDPAADQGVSRGDHSAGITRTRNSGRR